MSSNWVLKVPVPLSPHRQSQSSSVVVRFFFLLFPQNAPVLFYKNQQFAGKPMRSCPFGQSTSEKGLLVQDRVYRPAGGDLSETAFIHFHYCNSKAPVSSHISAWSKGGVVWVCQAPQIKKATAVAIHPGEVSTSREGTWIFFSHILLRTLTTGCWLFLFEEEGENTSQKSSSAQQFSRPGHFIKD